jgi:hypothetical protein
MRIAVLVPVTSRRRELACVAEGDLFRLFLPSFLATANWEPGYEYDLHVGIDDVDPFYAQARHRDALLDEARRLLAGRAARVHAHVLTGTTHAPCWAWNELFARAHASGADFFYQMGDDVRLVSAGWAEAFVATLRANPRLSGFGVVGPLETVARTILTQAFVSRLHWDVFGTLYPPAFKNWWSDDWITAVYRPGHTFFREDHLVDNVGGTERYEIDRSAQALLEGEVELGRRRIAAFLAARR